MSSTSSDTSYSLFISVGNSGDYDIGISMDSGSGIDDDFALSVATALQGLTWPTGTTFQLTKQAVSETSYTADLAASPAVFS